MNSRIFGRLIFIFIFIIAIFVFSLFLITFLARFRFWRWFLETNFQHYILSYESNFQLLKQDSYNGYDDFLTSLSQPHGHYQILAIEQNGNLANSIIFYFFQHCFIRKQMAVWYVHQFTIIQLGFYFDGKPGVM